ncbi:MAG: hypothetical protein IKK21_09180 [Clostridia bacterium]|nr:hypothetical protein [Clostridia bacterium]
MLTPLASDAFPAYRADQLDLSRYRKIPVASLAAMGAAFSQLPEGARTVMTKYAPKLGRGETLFVGYNPKNIDGFLRANQYGTVGNIMRINEQGKQVIAGRLRFKPVEAIPTTVLPIDPVSIAIAGALFSIEKKMDEISAQVEEVLQFLKLEKQSEQRGNLNMLAEIMKEFKQGHMDERLCTVRMTGVQEIKRIAHKDIMFYQEQISKRLSEQKAIHAAAQAQSLQDQVMGEFCEYQLASYLYAYATALETVLHGQYDTEQLRHTADTLKNHADRYDALYEQCHAQLANYQRKSVEAVLVGGLGSVIKAAGEKLNSVPVLSKGTVDEKLISAGDSIGQRNREAVAKRLERFETLADSRMRPFEESIRTLDVAHNQPEGLITDGENIYLLQVA